MIGGDVNKKFNVSLLGGDVVEGEKLFKAHPTAACARCHAVGKEGGNAGPNLKGIASKIVRKTLLEALIDPGKRIAPGFGGATVTLKNGEKLQGIFHGQDDKAVKVKVGNNMKVVKRTNLEKLQLAPSAMPPMGFFLKEHEVRDIVAYLNSLKAKKKQNKH